MNRIYGEVSDKEFAAAADPSEKEVASFALVWGVMLFAGVPILESISIAASVTPNARLRKIIIETYEEARNGGALAPYFQTRLDACHRDFVIALKTGERRENVGESLLNHAVVCSLAPGHVSSQLNWSKDLVSFTHRMAEFLGNGICVLSSLSCAIREAEDPFLQELKNVRGWVENGDPLSLALSKSPETFDRLYANIIRAGEVNHDLPRAFELLLLL